MKEGAGRRRLLGLLGAGAVAAVLSNSAASAPMPREQRGFALPTWERNGYCDFDTAQALHDMYTLGARWVELVPNRYQQTPTSNEVGSTGASVSEDDIRLAIDRAHDTCSSRTSTCWTAPTGSGLRRLIPKRGSGRTLALSSTWRSSPTSRSSGREFLGRAGSGSLSTATGSSPTSRYQPSRLSPA